MRKPVAAVPWGTNGVLVACDTGEAMVYDVKADAWTKLNKAPNTRRPVAVIPRGAKALVFIYDDGSARKFVLQPGPLRSWNEQRLAAMPNSPSPEAVSGGP